MKYQESLHFKQIAKTYYKPNTPSPFTRVVHINSSTIVILNSQIYIGTQPLNIVCTNACVDGSTLSLLTKTKIYVVDFEKHRADILDIPNCRKCTVKGQHIGLLADKQLKIFKDYALEKEYVEVEDFVLPETVIKDKHYHAEDSDYELTITDAEIRLRMKNVHNQPVTVIANSLWGECAYYYSVRIKNLFIITSSVAEEFVYLTEEGELFLEDEINALRVTAGDNYEQQYITGMWYECGRVYLIDVSGQVRTYIVCGIELDNQKTRNGGIHSRSMNDVGTEDEKIGGTDINAGHVYRLNGNRLDAVPDLNVLHVIRREDTIPVDTFEQENLAVSGKQVGHLEDVCDSTPNDDESNVSLRNLNINKQSFKERTPFSVSDKDKNEPLLGSPGKATLQTNNSTEKNISLKELSLCDSIGEQGSVLHSLPQIKDLKISIGRLVDDFSKIKAPTSAHPTYRLNTTEIPQLLTRVYNQMMNIEEPSYLLELNSMIAYLENYEGISEATIQSSIRHFDSVIRNVRPDYDAECTKVANQLKGMRIDTIKCYKEETIELCNVMYETDEIELDISHDQKKDNSAVDPIDRTQGSHFNQSRMSVESFGGSNKASKNGVDSERNAEDIDEWKHTGKTNNNDLDNELKESAGLDSLPNEEVNSEGGALDTNQILFSRVTQDTTDKSLHTSPGLIQSQMPSLLQQSNMSMGQQNMTMGLFNTPITIPDIFNSAPSNIFESISKTDFNVPAKVQADEDETKPATAFSRLAKNHSLFR